MKEWSGSWRELARGVLEPGEVYPQPEDLMRRLIEVGVSAVTERLAGPFAAAVATERGEVISIAVNQVALKKADLFGTGARPQKPSRPHGSERLGDRGGSFLRKRYQHAPGGLINMRPDSQDVGEELSIFPREKLDVVRDVEEQMDHSSFYS